MHQNLGCISSHGWGEAIASPPALKHSYSNGQTDSHESDIVRERVLRLA